MEPNWNGRKQEVVTCTTRPRIPRGFQHDSANISSLTPKHRTHPRIGNSQPRCSLLALRIAEVNHRASRGTVEEEIGEVGLVRRSIYSLDPDLNILNI